MLSVARPADASDVVIYKVAQSGRVVSYAQSLTDDAPSSENRKESEKGRQYFLHHRPTDTYRVITYFSEKTPQGRNRYYRNSIGDRSFMAVLETNYDDTRNELVFSKSGTGAGLNYFEAEDRYATIVETVTGRLKNQRIKTVLAGTLDLVVPSKLKGELVYEQMDRSDEVTIRTVTIIKESFKLDKKLTAAVFGLSLAEAQDAVATFLESKGYTLEP